MTLTVFEKCALGLSGVTALAIGVLILATPQAFYASYGIVIGSDASLLSELRSTAACLVALGILMLAGIVRRGWVQLSVVAALTVFLAFPTGRLIGLFADGPPSGGILGALILELVIAALCLAAFRHRLRPTAATRNG